MCRYVNENTLSIVPNSRDFFPFCYQFGGLRDSRLMIASLAIQCDSNEEGDKKEHGRGRGREGTRTQIFD